MGENPDHQYHAGRQQIRSPRPASRHETKAKPAEEDGIIKCLCQYEEDDGLTALCEQCNTWQHVDCFYWPHRNVPEVHLCADCLPRPHINAYVAAARQREKRAAAKHEAEEQKRKRAEKAAEKKAQKKAKPRGNGVHNHDQPNGFSPQPSRHENITADHGPPHKRAKTHHKHSQSVTDANDSPDHGHDQSNRTASQSPFKPAAAERPTQNFSQEFMRAYQDHERFQVKMEKAANGYSDLGVINTLSRWLNNPDNEHLWIYEDISLVEQEPPVQKIVQPIGDHATHFESVRLIATSPIRTDELVGPIVGEIGHRSEYMSDPANHWDRLKHPDNFVFFHPLLPEIFIDCRKRGSVMRFARRGCDFNVKVVTVITGERTVDNAHFCLAAARDIMPGEELVLGWKPLDERLVQCITAINSGVAPGRDNHEYVAAWVKNMLAHFGGCACDNKPGGPPCLMRKYDNALLQASRNLAMPRPTPSRYRSHKSPAKAERDNRSRGHSEGVHNLAHVREQENAVSSGRSSRSRTSREATPDDEDEEDEDEQEEETPNGGSAGASAEPSAREKRKMQQQLKLLERMDQENQKAEAKKKRRSGSHPNTPTLPLPKQPAPAKSSSARSLDPSLPSGTRSPNLEYSRYGSGIQTSRSGSSASTPVPSGKASSSVNKPRVKPVYVDAAVQTLPVEQSLPIRETKVTPYVPLSRRLLQRIHQRRIDESQDATIEGATPSVIPAVVRSTDLPPRESMGTETYTKSVNAGAPPDVSSSPVAMVAEPVTAPVSPAVEIITKPQLEVDTAKKSDRDSESPYTPAEPTPVLPPPPSARLDAEQDPPQQAETQKPPPARPTDMHVDMPPPQFPSTANGSGTNALHLSISESMVQSPPALKTSPSFAAPTAPMSALGLTSNAVNAVRPSPVKKKMSLSEYTNRNKARTPGIERSGSFGYGETLASARQDSSQSVDSQAVLQGSSSPRLKEDTDRPP